MTEKTAPLNWLKEDRIANSLVDCIKSITASALDKSILPFKNARFVNSPGKASLTPVSMTSSSI